MPYDSTEKAHKLNTLSDKTAYPMIYMSKLLSYNEQFTTTDNQTIYFNSAKFIFATGGVDEIDLNETYSYLSLNGDKLKIKTETYLIDPSSAFSGTIQSKLAVTIILQNNIPLFMSCNGTIEGGGSTKAITFVDNSSNGVIPIEIANGGTFRYLIRNTNGGSTDIYAGLIGEAEECTIEYCAMLMSINYTGNIGYTGGIVGYAKNSQISNCSMNGGSIVGSDNVGGIVGKAEGGTIAYCSSYSTINNAGSYVGGIVGYSNAATIRSCNSSCTINILSAETTKQYIGGIVGRQVGGSIVGETSNKTEFSGSIQAEGLADFVGGIAGGCSGVMVVSDAVFSGSEIRGRDYVGGIVGQMGNAMLSSCSTTGGTVSGRNYIGGIVGLATIYVGSCTSNSDIQGSGYLGGIAGSVNRISRCDAFSRISTVLTYIEDGGLRECVGGVAGYVINQCSYCTSNASISADGWDYVGGVVGKANCSVDNCTNDSNGSVSGRDHVGGIAGYAKSVTSTSTQKQLRNNLTVTGRGYVGGIAGEVGSTISNATNTKSITGVSYVGGIAGKADGVQSSTNYGNITINTSSTSSETPVNFGGIVGHASGTSSNAVVGCTSSGAVSANTADNVGGIAGNGNVYKSTNSGKVVGRNNSGGIVGSGTVMASVLSFSGGTTQSNAMVIGNNNVGGIIGNYLGGDNFDSKIDRLNDDGTNFIAVGNNRVGALIGYDTTTSNLNDREKIIEICAGIDSSILGRVASRDYDGTNGLVGNNSATLATRKTTDPKDENIYIKGNNGTLSYLITKELKS